MSFKFFSSNPLKKYFPVIHKKTMMKIDPGMKVLRNPWISVEKNFDVSSISSPLLIIRWLANLTW
jgi:hypothetical protein